MLLQLQARTASHCHASMTSVMSVYTLLFNIKLKIFLILPYFAGKEGKQLTSKYDLIGNVVHDGKPGAGGTYRLHVHRKSEDAWYEVQDLRVTDILPQMVALSETYMQVYELKSQS